MDGNRSNAMGELARETGPGRPIGAPNEDAVGSERKVSYGRAPFYIYSTSHDAESCGEQHTHEEFTFRDRTLEYDALAQFIATMANRGGGGRELRALVERGKELRPEIRRSLTVVVTGDGWGEPDVRYTSQ